MDTLCKPFRITLPTIVVAIIAVMLCACANLPAEKNRSNPYDVDGSNWHPPAVTAMDDTIAKINDSITITAAGVDNGSIATYVWAKDGPYSDSTDTGSWSTAWAGVGRKVVYVKAVDNDGVVSAPDSCIVDVTLDVPVAIAGHDTTVSVNDTVRLRGSAVDRLGRIVSWEWDIGNAGLLIKSSGSDTAFAAPAVENLNYRCVLRVTDDDGNSALDTVGVTVRRDAPVPEAGNDTVVWIGDTVLLHGSAAQQFGTIVKWEWKIGPGTWTVTRGPDTVLLMPDSGQTVACSLAVTDDDGNRAVDGKKITIGAKVMNAVAGNYHSFVLRSDSTLWACGDNYYGQIGLGTLTGARTPVLVMGGVQTMSAGASHSLILTSDGTLWVSGRNDYGQLGDGSGTNRVTFVRTLSTVRSVAAGGFHSLIVKTDGTLWACGRNDFGQLGDGTTNDKLVPVQVMSGVESVAAGWGYSLIVKVDKTLWACGDNTYGQLGDGTTTNRSIPVQVMSGVLCAAAAIGGNHTLILKSDNTLWGCGYNSLGELGDGTRNHRYTPFQMMSGVRSMAAGSTHTLIVKNDRTLWACGYDYYGQLGNGPGSATDTPVQTMTGVLRATGGADYSLIIKSDNTMWACGYNNMGQLGDGTQTTRSVPVRIVPPPQ